MVWSYPHHRPLPPRHAHAITAVDPVRPERNRNPRAEIAPPTMRHRARAVHPDRVEVDSVSGDLVASRWVPGDSARAASIQGLLAVVPRVEADLPAWLPKARAAFEASLAPWDALAAGRPVAIWPVSDGAISDIPSTLTFLRGRPAWGLVLDPASLLTPDMTANAEEHLARIAEALAGHSAMLGLVVPSRPLRADIERLILPALRPGAWVADFTDGPASTPRA